MCLWLWAELVDGRASRRHLGTGGNSGTGADTATSADTGTRSSANTGTRSSADTGTRSITDADSGHPVSTRTDAVIVLGYRNRGERANLVNRFRVRAGVRSLDVTAERPLLVLCGGAVGGATTEAELMKRYARDELGFRGTIILDPDSHSTWLNIANAIPHVEDADTIKIVSNAPHAEMGREILWTQRPDLAARLVRGDEHRFGEAPLLKILGALRATQSRLSGAWRTATDPHAAIRQVTAEHVTDQRAIDQRAID